MRRLITAALLVLGVLLVGASPAQAKDTVCVGTFSGVADNLVVPSGAACDLSGAHVRGNVLAQPGSSFGGLGMRIGGNVEAKNAHVFSRAGMVGGNLKCELCLSFHIVGTLVDGNVEIKGGSAVTAIEASDVGGNLDIVERSAGNSALVFLGVSVAGNVKFEKNSGPTQFFLNEIRGNFHVTENNVSGTFCPFPGGGGFPFPPCPVVDNGQFLDNLVGGHMQVVKNVGPIDISRNTIGKKLQCKENASSPTGAGNTARKKEGQCRTL
jgi:hypothetical protein